MKKNQLITAVRVISALLPLVVMGCSVGGPDYIDEYGINHGKGIEIDGVVWAPVNCGYHATDYPWGKLYQWGRKYGQGYDGDASTPTLVEGPVSLAVGNRESNSNVFYTDKGDWLSLNNDTLWNSGAEDAPIKTEYDPCSDGWRVPTYYELDALSQHRSSWTANELSQSGYWFSGSSLYSETSPRVFFPAAGCRRSYDRDAYFRGYYGIYWSSKPNGSYADYLGFGDERVYVNDNFRASGQSVRCVQD